MEKRTREKIALVVFALLVAFAAAVLIGYFTTGRSWNVAASFVDDHVGHMEGYTAIVYEGVIEPETDEVDGSTVSAEDDEEGASAAAVSDDAAFDDDAAASSGLAASGKTPGDTLDAASAEAPNADSSALSPSSAASASASSDEAAPTDSPGDFGFASGILSLIPTIPDNTAEEHLYVSDVHNHYEHKGAHALTLDVARPERYAEPCILYSGEKRIGVYSIDVYTTRARLKTYWQFFEENDADVVVCITPRASWLATYVNTDVVIVTTDVEGYSTLGETSSSTLVVCSPEQGSVGVVVLTTNNVPSAKTVESL